jgi:hypoxanthine phosphoribosyltransferase
MQREAPFGALFDWSCCLQAVDITRHPKANSPGWIGCGFCHRGGDRRTRSGTVHLIGDVRAGLAGRPVLLVDDIVDTGRSIAYAVAELRQSGVSGLWTCAVLDKPQRRQVEVALDFVGFSVGDLFVVGYGTDFAEKYRHLPYIGVVE